jgi:21S rRNA (uridine2791-2'-O)-methyltransferase
VSTIQGNFLSPAIQAEVRAYVQNPQRGRARSRDPAPAEQPGAEPQSYIDLERAASRADGDGDGTDSGGEAGTKKTLLRARDEAAGRVVDVVLSDMSAPWPQTAAFGVNSVSNPYRRMMNTTGVGFKDHVGSMVSFGYPVSIAAVWFWQ